MIEKINELANKIIDAGASLGDVNELIDAVGQYATEEAVKATTEQVMSIIKDAAEEGKAEYEAKLKETEE